MADIYLFAARQPVEVVRILDGELEGCEVERFPVYLVDGEEQVYCYCQQRRVRFREDGRRYILICLESDFVFPTGAVVKKVLDDGICHPDI